VTAPPSGRCLAASDAQIAHADQYEVAAYVRAKAPLASSLEAWAYADAHGKPPRREGRRRAKRMQPRGCCIFRGRSDKFVHIPE
jgi:hypothetical protein